MKIIILCILIIYIVSFINTDYVYDLSVSRKINYFNIYNISEFSQCLDTCDNEIYIDKFLPENIRIDIFPDKGWGLVSKKPVKKGDLIYMIPLSKCPAGDIIIISNEHGRKAVNKEIHLCDICRNANIFCYYDIFLNNDSTPNAIHDINLFIYKKKLFISIFALRDIKAGDEITIDYMNLIEPIYIIRSYLYYILPYYFEFLTYDHLNKGFESCLTHM